MRWQQRDDRKESPFNREMKGHHPRRQGETPEGSLPFLRSWDTPPRAQKAPIKNLTRRPGGGTQGLGTWGRQLCSLRKVCWEALQATGGGSGGNSISLTDLPDLVGARNHCHHSVPVWKPLSATQGVRPPRPKAKAWHGPDRCARGLWGTLPALPTGAQHGACSLPLLCGGYCYIID